MKTIKTLTLNTIQPIQKVELPIHFKALKLEIHQHVPTLWYECDTRINIEEQTILMYKTDTDIGFDQQTYLGTAFDRLERPRHYYLKHSRQIPVFS